MFKVAHKQLVRQCRCNFAAIKSYQLLKFCQLLIQLLIFLIFVKSTYDKFYSQILVKSLKKSIFLSLASYFFNKLSELQYIRTVFKTHSSIYDGVFCKKYLLTITAKKLRHRYLIGFYIHLSIILLIIFRN